MLHELAITPDVFDMSANLAGSEHALELRELSRDLADTGVVADFDKSGWSAEVRKRIGDWPEGRSKDLLSRYLGLLKDRQRLISYPKRKPVPPEGKSYWLDLARVAHKICPFDWIVYGERTGGPWAAKDDRAVTVLDVRHSDRWKTTRSTRVRMCEEVYRSTLTPLLRDAKWLQIVDPYVSFEPDRQFSIVKICAELLGNRRQGPLLGTITIHTERDPRQAKTIEDARSKWMRKIHQVKQELPIPHKFRVVIWEQDKGPDDLHDRFLITNQCGISVPGGLACYDEKTTRKTFWSLMSHESYLEAIEDYRPENHERLILADFII